MNAAEQLLGMTCGIYKLTSSSGKFYIGSSCQIERRLIQHGSDLRRGRHDNSRLQAAFNKHGPLAGSVVLICRKEDLIAFEQLCIDGLKPRYNQRQIANGANVTPASRTKISAALKGRTLSPEHRANLTLAQLRHGPLSEGAKAKLRAFNLGKTIPMEVRAKISAGMKRHRSANGQ